MDNPKGEYMSLEHHYIMTDSEGYIANVSDGLFSEMGLHPKFFNYSIEDAHSLINIESLCYTILDPDIQ